MLAETALWLLPEGMACAVGAKANVPFAVRNKITRLFNLSFSGARESLRLFELKKCAVGKIKNTEGSAMSVGLIIVRLKYGLCMLVTRKECPNN